MLELTFKVVQDDPEAVLGDGVCGALLRKLGVGRRERRLGCEGTRDRDARKSGQRLSVHRRAVGVGAHSVNEKYIRISVWS